MEMIPYPVRAARAPPISGKQRRTAVPAIDRVTVDG